MSYRKGRRAEEEVVRLLRSLLPDLEVVRSPLSKRFGTLDADIVISGSPLRAVWGEGRITVSVKYGEAVPSWIYRRSFFRVADVCDVGPLEAVKFSLPWEAIEEGGTPPSFILNEISRFHVLVARRKRAEWRVVAPVGRLPIERR